MQLLVIYSVFLVSTQAVKGFPFNDDFLDPDLVIPSNDLKSDLSLSLDDQGLGEIDEAVFEDIPEDLLEGYFGADPTFGLSSGLIQTVDSPILIWSKTSSYMTFTYKVVELPVNFLMSYDVVCVGDVEEIIFESEITINTAKVGFSDRVCEHLLNISGKPPRCSSFFVRVQSSMDGGRVDISEFEFGSKEICHPKNQRPKRTSFGCDFESGDCGLKNDACGLTEWKVGQGQQAAGRRKKDLFSFLNRRSTPITMTKPVALTKEKLTNTCNFHHVCIPCLQPSGFSVKSKRPAAWLGRLAQGPERNSRLTNGNALYLNPINSENKLAVGVFNTPSVVYHTSNRILKFSYDFFAQGKHEIVVGVVCVATSGRTSWIYLRNEVNFKVTSYKAAAYAQSGKSCLDLHAYVRLHHCIEFAIQFIGSAVYSPLAINYVGFHRDLSSALCDFVDNL